MPASVPRRNMLAADIVHVRDPKQQTTTPAVTVQVVRWIQAALLSESLVAQTGEMMLMDQSWETRP